MGRCLSYAWVLTILLSITSAIASPIEGPRSRTDLVHANSMPFVVPAETDGTPEARSAIQWGADDTWQHDFHNQSIGVDLEFSFYRSQSSSAVAVRHVVEWAEQGLSLAVGYPYSQMAVASGKAAKTYHVAQWATSASSAQLSSNRRYPYFSRLSPTSTDIVKSVVDTLLYMVDTQGVGWARVALLVSSDEYGVTAAQSFIDQTRHTPIAVATWQTYLLGSSDVSVEIREIVQSDARVIVVFAIDGHSVGVEEAKQQGLLDGNHVFIFSPIPPVTFPNGTINEEMVKDMRGSLGLTIKLNDQGGRYHRLLDHWVSQNPEENPEWGPGTLPDIYDELNYDLGVLVVRAMVAAHQQGLLGDGKVPSAKEWTRIARSIEFIGASGGVRMDESGDRLMPMWVVNWRPEAYSWKPVGIWTADDGAILYPDEAILWQDNTTNYPDLLLAPGYSYWSCSEGKKLFDDTGHSVTLHTPDSGGFDDIDASYICDNFIDCPNMSDESGDCSANYTALFIAFGIITGLLIVMTCCLIPFVIVFGFIIPRRRVKASSPTFLLIIILSCMLGYISEYSWYGRPHPVACGFRPWLLGLAVVSLVSALNAKTWRLWRIFKKAYKKERISDIRLIVLYVIMVIPAILILVIWTIVSTPTAGLKVQNDDHKHYVCKTGGFTGEPGGLVFFFILVGYEALVLLVAAVLVIVTRNVPSFFNESKLIAISIYNLGFLAAVVIPVIIVLDTFNPFAAWVIRSISVLYAFTATLVLQFAPKVIGVILIDRGREVALPNLGKTAMVRSSSSSEGSSLAGSSFG